MSDGGGGRQPTLRATPSVTAARSWTPPRPVRCRGLFVLDQQARSLAFSDEILSVRHGTMAFQEHVRRALDASEILVRRVRPVVDLLLNPSQRVPSAVRCAPVETGSGTPQVYDVRAAVAGEVEQLLPVGEVGRGGQHGHLAARTEPALAAVARVEPGVSLHRQHPGDGLAVEVLPARGAPVDPPGSKARSPGRSARTVSSISTSRYSSSSGDSAQHTYPPAAA